MNLISSQLQTKIWRRSQQWYINGRKNECENYQLSLLQSIIKHNLSKTNDRIFNKSIIHCPNPHINTNGFEYTENFDRLLNLEGTRYYFNLKFICDHGGAQTRTLKDVYHFCSLQLNLSALTNNTYFINIFDGNTSFQHMNKFKYLLDQHSNPPRVFIGDTLQFSSWWSRRFPIIL